MTIYRVNAPIPSQPPAPTQNGPFVFIESIPGIGPAIVNRRSKDITPVGVQQYGKSYPDYIDIMEQESDDYFVRIPKKTWQEMTRLIEEIYQAVKSK